MTCCGWHHILVATMWQPFCGCTLCQNSKDAHSFKKTGDSCLSPSNSLHSDNNLVLIVDQKRGWEATFILNEIASSLKEQLGSAVISVPRDGLSCVMVPLAISVELSSDAHSWFGPQVVITSRLYYCNASAWSCFWRMEDSAGIKYSNEIVQWHKL